MIKKNMGKILNRPHDRASISQKENRDALQKLFFNSPVNKNELLENLGLFLTSKNLARILFFNEIYKKIIDKEGVIMEFGIRWGQNTALLAALRGLYEPYNIKRKIIGFDIFDGFKKNSKKDNNEFPEGSLKLPKNYKKYINAILECIENDNPVNNIKKFEIIKGDAPIKLRQYLNKETHTLVSLVFFDMDTYEPTKKCLKVIKPYLTKGSIVAFDELNCDISKGITPALKETFDISKLEIKRFPHISRISYFEY